MRSKITIYITLTALSFCISCSRERNGMTVCESDLMGGIVVENGGVDTKCSGGYDGDGFLAQDMPYVTENGDTLYISAYLSDMDDPETVDTKGAPITSTLLGTYGDYTDFITRVYPSTGTSCYVSKKSEFDTNPRTMEEATVSYSSSKWNFDNKYYWPNSTDNLYFISIAPKVAWTNGNVFEHQAATCWNNYKYSFKYRTIVGTPSETTSGEDQYDLLLAYNKQKRSDYESNVHIDFKHACVGVRFIMGDEIFGTIGALALKNFYNEAKITLDEDTLSFSDYADLKTFTQEFNFETSVHQDKDPLDETTNSIKTFMVIPQKLINRGTDIPDADLVLSMGNTLHPEVLSFKDLADPSKEGGNAKLADWSSYAGKIITFRISSAKANNVSVTITDTVEGKTKKDIVITNDGRSDIFIRVKPVGNWLNKDGQVLAAWDENNPYGTFTSKNGFPNLNNTNWKKSSDGFYYYRKYLKGKVGTVVSENLFDTFTVTSKPVDSTGTWEEGGTDMQITQFELVLLVQAVIAESNLASFKAAWGDEMASWIGSTPESDE